jgi:uncharacterized protein YjiS (DUF1127 family)
MRTVPASSTLATVSPLVRVADRLAWLLKRIQLAWTGRRAAADLAQMDARLLADIGLTRGDVASAYEAPLAEDPTERLARVVRERRAAQIAQHREAAKGWR